MDSIFSGWLVGCYELVQPYMPGLLDRIDLAISRQDDFGSDFDLYMARLHKYRSLGAWAMQEAQQTPRFAQTCDWMLKSATLSNWGKAGLQTAFLDEYLALCVLAQRYAEGISAYEQHQGVPTDKRLTQSPRRFAYELCKAKAQGDVDTQPFYALGQKVLAANLERNWLGKGQVAVSVIWLNLVHGTLGGKQAPLEAVLAAHADMPGVEAPF